MTGFFSESENFIAVDADSVDTRLRQIIIRGCCRKGLNVLFVSDRPLKDVSDAHVQHKNVCQAVVRTDFDSADDFIFALKDNILFCITHDRILQSKLQENGVRVIDKRGNGGMVGSNIVYGRKKMKDIEAFSNSFSALLDACALSVKDGVASQANERQV
ncbi:MAG TPA: hypothetical protein DCO86_02840 [Spirochaetaceae bacterium]|nr:hypothetical protein [Spirochaetaceae bacterium]